MRSVLIRRGYLVAALLAILGATLSPVPGEETGTYVRCVFCGKRGGADVLLNVILFIPFGIACALQGWRSKRSILTATTLSACVECAQLFIPGRDSSVGDVFSNTLGGAIGVMLVGTASHWLRARSRLASRLSASAAIAAALAFFTTGVLLTPSFPKSLYYGQWTPDLGHLEWYRGRVLDATVGGVPVESGPLANSTTVRSLLLSDTGVLVQVRAIAGPRTAALASLFSIYDAQEREIILLGPDRDDLVLRFRVRAADWLLDQPDLRLLGGMRQAARNDTITTIIRGRSGNYCIAINGVGGCGLGYTVGSGWTVLLYPESLPSWLKALLDLTWIGGLLLPVGFWARARWESWLGGGIVATALLAAPAATPLLPTPLAEWAAAAAGFALGLSVRVVTRRAGPRSEGEDARRTSR